MTKQRLLIKDILLSSHGHLTAEEIYLTLKAKGINMAMGTVYRNLGLLVDSKEIARITVCDGPDIYDKTNTQHDHIICSVCGAVSDIDIGDMKEYIEKKSGKKIESYSLCINYVCPECKSKEY